MGFDDDVDQLKRELQTPKLDMAGRRGATSALCMKLKEKLSTRRLDFTYDEVEDPCFIVRHAASKEKLGSVTVNEDGSVTFQSALMDEEVDDYEDASYFPPYVEYYDEDEFLEEAPEMLKQGIAEFELDQEED